MQRWRRYATVTALAVGVLAMVPAVAGAATPNWDLSVPVAFAAGAQNADPFAMAQDVSCASAGNCTVVGFFKDAAGDSRAFTQTSTNGVWSNAVPATFADGIQNANPRSSLKAVWCTSAGNCTAVGWFKDVAGDQQAFTQTSTNGTWTQAVPATFGTGIQNANPEAQFESVSCSSARNCTAVGYFKDVAGDRQAFTQTSTNGTWAEAVPSTFGAGVQNANPDAELLSVSCSSAGNCTAAGWFKDAAGDKQAFTQTSTGGNWAEAVPATFGAGVQNANPYAIFESVSCSSAGNCTAVGRFKDAAGVGVGQAFTQTSTGGNWAEAVPATFGAGVQHPNPEATFFSVSCPSVGNCTAAGYFRDAAGNEQAFTQTSTNGTWAEAVPATFAAGIQNTNPATRFFSVSCASAGNCTAAGFFSDAAGDSRAFTQTSTNGVWADGDPATFADGSSYIAAGSSSYFNAVSCAGPGKCTAAGFLANGTWSNVQAFTQSTVQPILPPTGASIPLRLAVAFLVVGGVALAVSTSGAARRRRPA
jgi:hypothetical protein